MSGAMDPVAAQYEAYPYPARNPADEAKRLIEGSPSHPAEVDHFLFGGRRDWSRPFRALFAGGGTGDGLIMLAQKLADRGAPAEITYLDMSAASRRVAEARAAARGLGSIRFLTGDLLSAPDHGPFDYIDCTGVLHHLPDPDAGFAALAAALAPDGGLGAMVYAPYGRTGVYPLQGALAALTAGEAPEKQVEIAKATLKGLPKTNWFTQNRILGDHRESDAGLYDLLLHARDRPYDVEALIGALGRAGLALTSFTEPLRYEPALYLPAALHPRLEGLAPTARAAMAERLAGNMKAHVFYAARGARKPAGLSPEARPRLGALSPAALAAQIARRGGLRVERDGLTHTLAIPRQAAELIALADGRLRLGEIARVRRIDWFAFAALWKPAHDALTGFNLLRYSEGMR
ncbi:class I SAM-dependent methyltransferase [Pikeienuella sp. HZG-20]|uniref:class I SAM-dependent methyltransferase n=1 Tax=Paludibacillus litoralis TaxID=3133267 RepID=UPI0030EEBC68